MPDISDAFPRPPRWRFVADEAGAVTVDWVVLTAAAVGLGLAATSVVRTGVGDLSNDIRDMLEASEIASDFAPGTVLQDFSEGAAGWLLSRGIGSATVQYDTGAGSDGEPGFLRFHDDGNGGAAYLGLPEGYVSDQSGLMGGAISFDMQMVSGGRAIGDNEARYPILRLTGADGSVMTLASDYAPDAGGWSNFSADIDVDAGWTVDGQAATAGQMRSILSDVASSELRIEQAYGGNEIIGLDNVQYTPGS